MRQVIQQCYKVIFTEHFTVLRTIYTLFSQWIPRDWISFLLLFLWGLNFTVRLVWTLSSLQMWEASPLRFHNQKADLDSHPSLAKALKHKTVLPLHIFEGVLCFSGEVSHHPPKDSTAPPLPHMLTHVHTYTDTWSSVAAWCEGCSVIIHSRLSKISQNKIEGLGLSL